MLGIFPLQLILYTGKILSVHSPAAFQTLFRLSELRPLAFPKPIPCQYEQASPLAQLTFLNSKTPKHDLQAHENM